MKDNRKIEKYITGADKKPDVMILCTIE